MAHRFYCPLLAETGAVLLTETEAHHLVHVLRTQVDDRVELFNGAGLAAMCRVAEIRKRDVTLEVITAAKDEPIQKKVILATAVPKGDRFDWLIEKATELGVSQLIPLTTSRSVVDPRSSKLDKLRQTVVAACKQSGRNSLMEITAVTSWKDFLKGSASVSKVLVAHPGGIDLEEAVQAGYVDTNPVCFAIGPEGGFTDEEIELARLAGAHSIQLGRQILRIETAAVALAARFLL